MPNGDYRGFKKQGDPLQISALAFNRWQRAATWVEGQQQSQAADRGRPLPEGMCWIQNSSGTVVDRFGVLGISGTFFSNTSSSALQAMQGDLVLTGVTPTIADYSGKFAITYEPIAIGAFGRAFAFGVCAVQVQVNSVDDAFADVMDGDLTQLNSGKSGAVQILSHPASTGAQWCLVRFGSTGGDRALFVTPTAYLGGGSYNGVYVTLSNYNSANQSFANASNGSPVIIVNGPEYGSAAAVPYLIGPWAAGTGYGPLIGTKIDVDAVTGYDVVLVNATGLVPCNSSSGSMGGG